MAEFKLADAERARLRITAAQQKQISDIYNKMAKEARAKVKALEGIDSVSAKIQRMQLTKLAKELSKAAADTMTDLQGAITGNMVSVAEAVVASAQGFNTAVGLNMAGAFSHVPQDVVASLTTGKLYGGNWSLSKAIYTDIRKTQMDINAMVAQGLAANKSAFEIAKDLEMYVDPAARKPWDWGKVYPGSKQKIDYNAQRLARTMASHAYQQSLVTTVKHNPFVEGIKWRSGHTDRTCEICNERDGKVYPKSALPLDHPNGLCTFIADIPKDYDQIADELADWAKGKPNKGLDAWVASMKK